MNRIPNEIQENFYCLVESASDKGTFEEWVTELLEWNSVRFFSSQIDEFVWRGTKEFIENRMATINNII